uniref:Col_cuticle_N domain-containing protein n=1 Tax=Rhabditophanes sp. KR3021 TaxID=114890 RepID=A0AC35UI11_9BILA
MSDTKVQAREAASMKQLALFSITVSTIATIVAIIAVPMVYSYLQHVQSNLQVEVDFCRHRSEGLWEEYIKVERVHGVAGRIKRSTMRRSSGSTAFAPSDKIKRDAYGGDSAPVESHHTSAGQQACSCGSGLAGPAGAPGTDGAPGKDGLAGKNGKNGGDARPDDELKETDICFTCADAPAGPAGPSGPKGPNGQAGAPGAPGSNGQDGQAGAPGAPGQDGKPGSNGQPGAAGKDGVQTTVEGPAGPAGSNGNPGAAGKDGAPGANGNAGHAGSDGKPGAPGAPGAKGQDGAPGNQGEAGPQGSGEGCSHCPPPRSAPGNSSLFEKIRGFSESEYGVWLTTVHSSLIQLWKKEDCVLLFDITYDHCHRKPSFDEDDREAVEISTIMYFEKTVWVGTIDGYLLLYEVKEEPVKGDLNEPIRDTINSKEKYPPGKRISPDFNLEEQHHEMPLHKKNIYYIPTKNETAHEEALREEELSTSDEKGQKISVRMDKNTQRYSISVEPLTDIDGSFGNNEEVRRHTLNTVDAVNNKAIVRRKSTLSGVKRYCMNKGLSISTNSTSRSPQHEPILPLFRKNSTKPSYQSSSVSDLINEEDEPSSPVHTNPSLEYDDLFEMYSDEETHTYHEVSGLAVDYLGENSVKLVQIPKRKSSCRMSKMVELGTSESDDTLSSFHLRRKDLDLDVGPVQPVIKNVVPNKVLQMALLMKLKIADSTIKSIAVSCVNGENIILTASGSYQEEECLLYWKKEPETNLWINDPLEDVKFRKLPAYKKSFRFSFPGKSD